ncbi:DNA recombination protein RmuC [Rhodobacteraceae bacterium KN286]|uniref:DNA recombination protein RmuC homolog n=2 Tax=Oceanomicrobium pacificus TaxID=2692916 RepID=A0A6B0TRV6_9RHOB|nr:DNA recombination protein RmuC [Oceanomicrobium pacificus]MXU64545.1 DNA recombination protein RmuC [Oceanomicrobium pacificus]
MMRADPVLAALTLGGAVLLLLFLMVWLVLRAQIRATSVLTPMQGEMQAQMQALGETVRSLSMGQQQLAGGLQQVAEAQTRAQSHLQQNIDRRLEEVQRGMAETLHGSSTRTARSLGELQQRLEVIDRAQSNIEKLSGDVLSLQDILSNKQTRGAFGEIQLNDIVSKALPADSYAFQAVLGNGKRADCLIHLPKPPGPIVIDSKFPLEAYEALRAAGSEAERQAAARALRTAVRTHIRAISERYIIEGETADGALMFLPSEAVYAELHANFGDVVREGFAARVWIVSPTTCMATLNTMRAVLKDARMKEQAGAIRRELGLLHKDVDRLEARVGNLDRHFAQAAKDVDEIKISAGKAGKRARALDRFEFEDLPGADEAVRPLRLTPQD